MESLVVTLAAKRLGLGAANLRREMLSGRSIVEVAGNMGVKEQELVDTLMSPRIELLDLGVEYGCHTAQRAEEMLSFMEVRTRNQLRRRGLCPGRVTTVALDALVERATAA